MTEAQKAWIAKYERVTGFDLIVAVEGMSFEQIARWNIDWWGSYANECMRQIYNYPEAEWEE